MREPEDVDCCHAWECFGDSGPWGKGAFDDPQSHACGGKPWMECHCMTEEERKELKVIGGEENDKMYADKIKKQGAKWDDGKVDWSYLPSGAVGEVLKIYAGGAKKYGRGNYLKGIHYSRVFSAAMRHLWAWWRGEEIDQESGLSHLAHAAWNVLTLLEYTTQSTKYKDFDDRQPPDIIKITVTASSGYTSPLKFEYEENP